LTCWPPLPPLRLVLKLTSARRFSMLGAIVQKYKGIFQVVIFFV
jgi:hypothetical protein